MFLDPFLIRQAMQWRVHGILMQTQACQVFNIDDELMYRRPLVLLLFPPNPFCPLSFYLQSGGYSEPSILLPNKPIRLTLRRKTRRLEKIRSGHGESFFFLLQSQFSVAFV